MVADHIRHEDERPVPTLRPELTFRCERDAGGERHVAQHLDHAAIAAVGQAVRDQRWIVNTHAHHHREARPFVHARLGEQHMLDPRHARIIGSLRTSD